MLPAGYTLIRKTGSGAMAEVYQALCTENAETVAIKLLRPEFCEDEGLVGRFCHEATILAQVRHQNLVAVHGWGRLAHDQPYLVMEWLEGTLMQWLPKGGLPIAVVRRIMGQIARGLLALHERGVVHRDLKPSNVLLTCSDLSKAQVKLGDLGLAKVLLEGQRPSGLTWPSTSRGALLGTWEYMAPEQWISAKEAGPEVDVYALGVLWFQLLTGRVPFLDADQNQLMYMHLFEDAPLALLPRDLPRRERTLLRRMLGKKKKERPTLLEVIALYA